MKRRMGNKVSSKQYYLPGDLKDKIVKTMEALIEQNINLRKEIKELKIENESLNITINTITEIKDKIDYLKDVFE